MIKSSLDRPRTVTSPRFSVPLKFQARTGRPNQVDLSTGAGCSLAVAGVGVEKENPLGIKGLVRNGLLTWITIVQPSYQRAHFTTHDSICYCCVWILSPLDRIRVCIVSLRYIGSEPVSYPSAISPPQTTPPAPPPPPNPRPSPLLLLPPPRSDRERLDSSPFSAFRFAFLVGWMRNLRFLWSCLANY